MHLAALVHALKEGLHDLSGGDRALAHVHAGLAVYAAAQVIWTRRTAVKGLLLVIAMVIVNEAFVATFTNDWTPDQRLWPATMTLFWPMVFTALAWRRRWHLAATLVRFPQAGRAATAPSVEAPVPKKPAQLQVVPAGARTAATTQRRASGGAPRLRVFPGAAAREQ